MIIPNQPTAASLDDMTEADLAALHAGVLADIQTEVDADLAKAKKRRSVLDAVLERRYGGVARAERLRRGKDSGTVRLPDGGCTIVAEGRKEVKWDQDGLADLQRRMIGAGDNPNVYIIEKAELTVSETPYGDWPEAIKKAFEAHRTVTVKPKYKIERKESE